MTHGEMVAHPRQHQQLQSRLTMPRETMAHQHQPLQVVAAVEMLNSAARAAPEMRNNPSGEDLEVSAAVGIVIDRMANQVAI